MSELSQHHPDSEFLGSRTYKTEDFFIIENTPRDVIILQRENNMKACLGLNVKISLPKAYKMKEKSSTLVVKGVPTGLTDDEFKEIFALNKIQYAKAECMKSRRDGRSLQMFQTELKDPVEAEAIIAENLKCPQTGIIFKVEEFRASVSVRECYSCQNFGHSLKNCQAKTKCVICREGHSR